MNKKIMTFIVAGFMALSVVVSVPVAAHDGEDHPPQVMAQVNEGNGSKPDPEALKARLQQRKDAQKVRLSNAQKTRLQSRCKNAQGKIMSVEGRIHGIETSRNQVYSNLVDRLTNLSARLKDKGVDTAQLDEQVEALEGQIADFKNDLAEYKQAVVDLAAMDCESDPEAFQAALEQARSLRQELHESGQAIKSYVRETIKPTLVAIRTALAEQEGEAGDEEASE